MRTPPRVPVFLPGLADDLVRELDRYGLPVEFVTCFDEDDVAKNVGSAEILVSNPVSRLSLSTASNLKWIQSLSAGVETWLHSAPPLIPVTRMVGVYERYMAEYVFAHLLWRSQRLDELFRAQAERAWPPITTSSVCGLTLGVAGIGHIGTTVAALAKAFGMAVRGLRRGTQTRPLVDGAADVYFDGSHLVDFVTGLDVLVITLPATPATDALFGLRELMCLNRGAVVINIGRGQVLDEGALLELLRDGHLSRAVIDTFREEPLPKDNPLWEAPNITITPHMAGAVYPDELARVAARNIRTFLGGQIPEPTLNRELAY